MRKDAEDEFILMVYMEWAGVDQRAQPHSWVSRGPHKCIILTDTATKPLLVPHIRHVNRKVTKTMKIPALKLTLNIMVTFYLMLLDLQNFKPNLGLKLCEIISF